MPSEAYSDDIFQVPALMFRSAYSYPLSDVFQIGILFDQSRHVVQTHGKHSQISADRIDMPRAAVAFECHHHKSKAE